jgi:uncharacterized protein YbcI
LEELKTDILIVGGGVAGIAAAVGASDNNNNVLLIDANGYLGGNATVSEVGTICGLYHYNFGENTSFIVNGFPKEFAERIRIKSNSKPIKNKFGLHYLPYDTNAFKSVALDTLIENNVKYLFNSIVTDVQLEGDQITSIVVVNGKTRKKISCNSVIDCSGISIISEKANQPLLKSDLYQSAAIVFEVSNIDIQSEFGINILLTKEIKMLHSNSVKNKSFHSAHVIPGSLKNGTAHFKLGIPIKVTDEKENHDYLKEVGVELVKELFEIMQTRIKAFKGSKLHHIADNVGIRVQKRPIGKYVLNESDVVECKKFPDAVAKSAWPIEEWDEDLKVSISPVKENDWYEIPKQSLMSKSITNLFFGGKNISATDRAIGSARVMGVCLQTGHSAGKLALEFKGSSTK